MKISREDADRICKAHGWNLLDFDDGFALYEVSVGRGGMWLGPEALAALDPDRPPTLDQLRRLSDGIAEVQKDSRYAVWGLDEIALCRDAGGAKDILARAWKLGAP